MCWCGKCGGESKLRAGARNYSDRYTDARVNKDKKKNKAKSDSRKQQNGHFCLFFLFWRALCKKNLAALGYLRSFVFFCTPK